MVIYICTNKYLRDSGDSMVLTYRLNAPPCSAVRLEGRFWKPRLETNRTKTLPHLLQMLRSGGRLALQSGAPASSIDYKMYWETEIARYIEAASDCLACRYDAGLDALLDGVITLTVSVQQPDGYLNAYITHIKPDKRWKHLFTCHELYNAGALMEAAAAHFRATGKRTLLEPVCRYADYIDSVFGAEDGKLKGYCGHPGVEMGLVSLYQATGNPRYLSLARYFVEQRGQLPNWFDTEETGSTALYWVDSLRNFYRNHNRDFHEFNQSHLPARRLREAVGHAVRAVYFYAGMADIALEYDDEGLMDACIALWEDICGKRMYVTGGVGDEYAIEGFGPAYHLPNGSAYAETCAAAGLVFFGDRMLRLTGEGRYADVIERVLYNLLPASVSLDGTAFFYQNPQQSDGSATRQEIFTCACCPPNAARLLASLGSYFYAYNDEAVYVNQYASSEARLHAGGTGVTVEQETNYPWDGAINLTVTPDRPAEFTLCLRLPAWCQHYGVALNGEELKEGIIPINGYIRLKRQWRQGDALSLRLEMPVTRARAHPRVSDNIGKVALARGPVVYCLEETDNIHELERICIPEDAVLNVEHREDLLGGICVITGEGRKLRLDGWNGALYRAEPADWEPYYFTAVPYAVWGNRGSGAMRIWMGSM